MPIAVYTEQDLFAIANVSPKLLHSVREVHIPFYSRLLNKSTITVDAERIEAVTFDGSAVATGCSLGVDSLSTIYHYTSTEIIPEYRLTHLALFNSSQLGDHNQEKLNVAFDEACKKVRPFAKEIGLSMLEVNTNITELLSWTDIGCLQVVSYFTVATVLSMQKLLKRYFISSTYSAENTHIDIRDVEYTEAVFLPLLGNENVDIVLSDTFCTRTKKTEFISKKRLTQKYLDVCWSTQTSNLNGSTDKYLVGKKKRNCGWCDKCLMTLFTLEQFGSLDSYGDIFDLSMYYKYKKPFIFKFVACSRSNAYYTDLFKFAKANKIKLPFGALLLRTLNLNQNKFLKMIWSFFLDIKARR